MNDMQQTPPTEDKLNVGLTIISFCIPLVGAIIYFMKKDKEPKSAKTACVAALVGVGVGIVINVIATIAGIGLGGMSGN